MRRSEAEILFNACQNRGLFRKFNDETGVLIIGDRSFYNYRDAEGYLASLPRTDLPERGNQHR